MAVARTQTFWPFSVGNLPELDSLTEELRTIDTHQRLTATKIKTCDKTKIENLSRSTVDISIFKKQSGFQTKNG